MKLLYHQAARTSQTVQHYPIALSCSKTGSFSMCDACADSALRLLNFAKEEEICVQDALHSGQSRCHLPASEQQSNFPPVHHVATAPGQPLTQESESLCCGQLALRL